MCLGRRDESWEKKIKVTATITFTARYRYAPLSCANMFLKVLPYW